MYVFVILKFCPDSRSGGALLNLQAGGNIRLPFLCLRLSEEDGVE
jgi:hypothetical protein